jgi:hypothetical protein
MSNPYIPDSRDIEGSIHEEFERERQRVKNAFDDVSDDIQNLDSSSGPASGNTFFNSVKGLPDGEYVSIQRLSLPSDRKASVLSARVGDENDNSVSGLEVELYNHTDDQTIYSTEQNTLTFGSPLASGGNGDSIELRINNNSGNPVDAQGLMIIKFEVV